MHKENYSFEEFKYRLKMERSPTWKRLALLRTGRSSYFEQIRYECLLNLNIKLRLEVNSEPIHVQVISDFRQNVKRWTSEIFSREDLERVNEEFHENGTVSYETKKVSFLRRDDIPRWFYKVDDLRLF